MIRKIKRFLLVVVLLIGCKDLYSQIIKSKHSLNLTIDSLITELATIKADSTKLKILRELYRIKFDMTFESGSSDYSSVIKHANHAAILSEKLGNRYEKGQALKMLGQVAMEKGNLSESLNYFLLCLKNAEDMGDKACAANQYYSIAIIYDDLEMDTLAFNYSLISLKMQKESGFKNILPNTYNRIARFYENRGNYSEALANYKLGLEAALQIKYKLFEGIIYKGMGNTFLLLKNYELASAYLFASLKIMEELNNEHYKMEIINHIGHYYTELYLASTNRFSKVLFDSSIYYLLKAEKLGKRFNYSSALIYTYKELAKAYKEVGDYQRAIRYLELYEKSNDSLSTAKSKNLISEINKRNAAEKTDLLNKIQIEKIQIQKDNTKRLVSISAALILIITIILLLYYRQRNQKKRAIEKANSIHKMAELEMQSLRSQMNPHFMFNSLNSIQAMIMKEQTDKSQSYLSRFARLLRMLLENADKQFVPLRIEMEFLQLYLSLESLRVPDMQYSISTDPLLDKEQILIPNMILQPYVENAIWHGLSHKETDKQLQIRIFRENGTINYEIEDNGVGRKKAGELKSLFRKQHQSKGMELLNKRIELLNKEYSSVVKTEVADVIKNKEVSGTMVSIKVPLTLSQISQNKI